MPTTPAAVRAKIDRFIPAHAGNTLATRIDGSSAGLELETCVVRGRPGYHGVAVLDVGTNLPPDHLANPVAILS